MTKRVLIHVGMLALVVLLSSPARSQDCVGDCNEDGAVPINELILLVNIAGGTTPLASCTPGVIDVDGNGSADINELVLGVVSSISMCGTKPLPTFTPTPSITPTTVAANTSTPTPSPTVDAGEPLCGNGGEPEEGEDCDDGNNLGGDDCAANCTFETLRKSNFIPSQSISFVQSTALQIRLQLRGQQVFTTGRQRDEVVFNASGTAIFQPGEIPVVVKVTGDPTKDVVFEPVRVQGIVCACVTQVPVPGLFGPANCSQTTTIECTRDRDCPSDEKCQGISAVGKISCGAQGLTDIDYRLVQDHNTVPGNPNNGASSGSLRQEPNDPECNDSFRFPSGVESNACLEGTGELCSENRYIHHPPTASPAVCNSPRVVEFFGGQQPIGSALINNNTAIGLLSDSGFCDLTQPKNPDGSCRYPDYGPDCIPCTRDDVDLGLAENLPTTTGFASSALFDATNRAGSNPGSTIDRTEAGQACAMDNQCEPGAQCRRTCTESGFVCTNNTACVGGTDICATQAQCDFICAGNRRCRTEAQGTRFDCQALADDETGGLTGVCLAVTFPAIDALRIGDNVTSTLLCFE